MHCLRDKDCQYLFQCLQNQCTHSDLFHMDGVVSFALLLLIILVSISLFARVSAGSVKYIIFILILNYNADVANLMTQCSMFGSALILFYLSLKQSHPQKDSQTAINNNIVILVLPIALFSLNLGRFLQQFTSLIIIEGIAFLALIPILVLYVHQYKQQKIAQKIASGQLKSVLPRRYSQINDKIRKSRLLNTLQLVVIHEQQQKNEQSHIDDINWKSKFDSHSQRTEPILKQKTQQNLNLSLLVERSGQDQTTSSQKNGKNDQTKNCISFCKIKYPWLDIFIGFLELTFFITAWVFVEYYIAEHYLKLLILLALTVVETIFVLLYLNMKHIENHEIRNDLDLNIFRKKYTQDSGLSVDGLRNVIILTVVSCIASVLQGYAFLGFCQIMLLLFLFSGVPNKVGVCTLSYLLAMFSVYQLVSCLYFYSTSTNQQVVQQLSIAGIIFLICMCSLVAFALLFLLKKILNKRSAEDKILIMGIAFTMINILGIFGAILKNVI